MADSVDPDETAHNQDLHCLQKCFGPQAERVNISLVS